MTVHSKPVTLAELERAFDLVARRMQKIKKPELYLPIWRALERERKRLTEEKRIFGEARDRTKSHRH